MLLIFPKRGVKESPYLLQNYGGCEVVFHIVFDTQKTKKKLLFDQRKKKRLSSLILKKNQKEIRQSRGEGKGLQFWRHYHSRFIKIEKLLSFFLPSF